MQGDGFKFNSNKALFSLNLGVNYKFGTSNGTHNFAKEQLRDQAEIDALNAKLNAAQADANAAKANSASLDSKIADLQKSLNDCMNRPATNAIAVKAAKANLQPSVIFKQGKYNVERSQEANVEMIAKYMQNNKDAKIKISGYASPEGPAALNQTLSEKRAEACKDILVKKYKIDANRIQTEGLGATDKLFDEVEFNRVALFNDTSK
jgi:outer membrane protein OmpA-like peptidoglycan-associated protein